MTLVALVSFALNSLLCRAALGSGLIDATSFTLIRLAAGAAVLGLLSRASRRQVAASGTSYHDRTLSALALFLYALPFSLAYLRIPAGTGAFVAFGCVQITMIGSEFLSGRRMGVSEGLGLIVALSGLAWLTRPGSTAPDLVGCALMALAGFSWGIYSILGRRGGAPLLVSARNFAATLPLAVMASAWTFASAHVTPMGLCLGLISGGVTSGLGYVAWYAALPSLGATRASIVQLSVPPLASVLGILLLGEVLTERLMVAGPMILGGIAIAVRKPTGKALAERRT